MILAGVRSQPVRRRKHHRSRTGHSQVSFRVSLLERVLAR
jgi:hypothetical protein